MTNSSTPPVNLWREAVLDRLAVLCLDAPQDEPPESILRRIIEAEVAIALDPRVSDAAPPAAPAPAVSAAKDAEISGLRAERDNMAAAIAQLLRDNRDVHEKVVRPLRERVRVLEDTRPEPDCRTCKRSAIQHGVTRCMSPYFCTNADHYEPLPPVRLWRTT